ncbi:aldo/keto reductase [Aliikangiella marina]|uniref:Aldo/keto reductase n=1 Tax=Aliikangiella marina TaxID=1712262 RepID=A0A545T0X8_9GAMM|nr:aldo/keto reductase [Aliikangiella marina]TQV70878.1 aldo/keto reductase [Aliikangiella marina]
MLNYKLLGKSGLRVSELCLGTMSFGQDWGFGADEKTSRQIMDVFKAAGGNFIDTADKYHNGETEAYIGRWLQNDRDRMVVATKYTLSMDHTDPNASGNQRKNMMRAVEGSLKRLNTDYIDLLWVHAYDDDTPYQETMRALDDLVSQGKINYIGISDTPAWVVSASNTLAELRGWTQFIGIQAEYNLLTRDLERELLPMANQFDLGITAWAPLAGGVLTGKYTRAGDNDSLRQSGNQEKGRSSAKGLAIAKVVDEIADAHGVSSTQIALAWIMAQGYRFIPVVGARKVNQIEDSIAASQIKLSEESLNRLNQLTQIELGFPHDFLASDHIQEMVKGEQVRHRILRKS